MEAGFCPPIRSYDVHVYFAEDQVSRAKELHQSIKDGFPQLKVYKFWSDPIGPHPIGNFEVNLRNPNDFSTFVPWMCIHRNGFSVLVHPNTGRPIEDHTVNAMWMGDKITLSTDRLQEKDDTYGYFTW